MPDPAATLLLPVLALAALLFFACIAAAVLSSRRQQRPEEAAPAPAPEAPEAAPPDPATLAALAERIKAYDRSQARIAPLTRFGRVGDRTLRDILHEAEHFSDADLGSIARELLALPVEARERVLGMVRSGAGGSSTKQ